MPKVSLLKFLTKTYKLNTLKVFATLGIILSISIFTLGLFWIYTEGPSSNIEETDLNPALVKIPGPKPFNYKLAYSYKGKIYVYDLASNKTQEVDFKTDTLASSFDNNFEWSNDGKIAFINKESVYLLESPYTTPKLLLSNFQSEFSWSREGDGFYYGKTFRQGEQVHWPMGDASKDTDAVKYYFYLLDTQKEKEISEVEYNNATNSSYPETVTNRASFDGRYQANQTYLEGNTDNRKASLVDTKTGQVFNLPDGYNAVSISKNNTYLATTEIKDFQDSEPFRVFLLKDVLVGDFSKPVLELSGINSEHVWSDDSHILYATCTPTGKPTTDALRQEVNCTFQSLNVKTNTTKDFTQHFTTTQLYIPIRITPDGKNFEYDVDHYDVDEKGNESNYKTEVIVSSLSTEKIVTKFYTDTYNSFWSEPFLSN